MDSEVQDRLDRIASALSHAEAINSIHACRQGHPLGRDNPYKWRNAYAMVRQAPYSDRRDISYRDEDWLAEMASQEAKDT